MSDPGAGVPEEEPMEEERAQMEDEMDESDEDDTNDTSVSECEKEEKGGKKKVSASKEAGRSKTKNTRSKQRKRKRSVNQRRNIRKVLKTDQLDPKTLEAQQEEQERLKRLEALKNVTSPKQGQGSKQKKHQQKKKKQEHETEGQIIHRQHSTDAIHPQLSLEALVANLKSTSRSDKAGRSNSEEGTQAAQDQPSGITDTISATDSNTGKSALSQEIDTVTEVLSDAESFSESDYSDEDVIVLDDDDDNDDDIISQKEVVLVLSSEEEEDSTDEEDDADDNGDIGSHTNDNLNQANDIGKVLVNVGHPVDEPDIFLPPQITRAVKPHQVCNLYVL